MKKQRRAPAISGAKFASSEKPLLEPRLWGTWKSDRRKTFEHVVLPKATPEGLKKFRSLFGKMVVTWTKTTIASYFDCDRFMGFPNDRTPEVREYTVVARDAHCVVICKGRRHPGSKIDAATARFLDELDEPGPLVTIEFDENRGYRISLGTFFEYFRRIR